MATVTTNTNLTAVTYVAAEDITITNSAILTVDSTPAILPGSFLNITNATLKVENSSTTTPIVLTLSSNVKDYRNEKNGKMIVRGQPIIALVGDGTANQTVDMSVAPYNTIPYPSYVEVETANGSNEYRPFQVICTAGKTITFPVTNFSTLEAGDVVFWNATTRILKFGNGTNGNLIPTGCRVRIPNIYIHSATNNATQSARTLIDLNPGGTLDAEWCAFSDAIYIANNSFGYLRMEHCGLVSSFIANQSNGDITLKYCSGSHDTQQKVNGNGINLSDTQGEVRLNRINFMCATEIAPGANVNNIDTASVVELENIVLCTLGRQFNTTRNFIGKVKLPIIRNIVSIGAEMRFADMKDVTIIDIGTAESFSPNQNTLVGSQAINIVTSENINIIGIRNAGVASHRVGLVTCDVTATNVSVFNVDYDAKNNMQGFCIPNGTGFNAYNLIMRNLPTSSTFVNPNQTFLGKNANIANIRATWAGTLTDYGLSNGLYNGVAGDPTGNSFMAFNVAKDFNSALLLNNSLTPIDGNIVFGSLGTSTRNALTGTALLDKTGGVELPNIGDSIEMESLVFNGITSFKNVAPAWTYVSGGVTTFDGSLPASITSEFAIANPTGAYTAYQTMNATNLSNAIAGLAGYDSLVGLKIKVKLTATTTDTTRLVRRGFFPINYNNAYIAPNSFVAIEGSNPTDNLYIYKSSDNSLLGSRVGDGNLIFPATYGDDAYIVRKNSSNVEIMRTQTTPFTMVFGDNGLIKVYSGDEIQLAKASSVATETASQVWNYTERTLNKALFK